MTLYFEGFRTRCFHFCSPFFPLKDLPTRQFSFDKLLSIFWLSQKLEITLETVEVLESKKHLSKFFLLLFSHGKAFRFLKLCKERDIKVFSGSWNCIKAWKLANSLTSYATVEVELESNSIYSSTFVCRRSSEYCQPQGYYQNAISQFSH